MNISEKAYYGVEFGLILQVQKDKPPGGAIATLNAMCQMSINFAGLEKIKNAALQIKNGYEEAYRKSYTICKVWKWIKSFFFESDLAKVNRIYNEIMAKKGTPDIKSESVTGSASNNESALSKFNMPLRPHFPKAEREAAERHIQRTLDRDSESAGEIVSTEEFDKQEEQLSKIEAEAIALREASEAPKRNLEPSVPPQAAPAPTNPEVAPEDTIPSSGIDAGDQDQFVESFNDSSIEPRQSQRQAENTSMQRQSNVSFLQNLKIAAMTAFVGFVDES